MKIKKLLSILLVLSLAMCIFPASAFAFNAGSAAEKSPWYAICTGDGVRIRSTPSASSTQNIVGQIDKNQPIEVIGVTSDKSWYKVKYTVSENIGYVSSSYLTITHTSYGYVLSINGISMRSQADATGQVICTIPTQRYMPYNTSFTVSQNYWLHCVCGRTDGWVNTEGGYGFKYKEL